MENKERCSPGHHEVCKHLDVVMIFEAVLDMTQELKDVKPVKKENSGDKGKDKRQDTDLSTQVSSSVYIHSNAAC